MRSYVVVLLLSLAFVPGVARAQEKQPEAPKPADGPEVEIAKSMVQVLKDELELTSDQVEKATTVIQEGVREGFKKMMKHMGEDQPDEEQIKKEREEVRDGIVGKLRDLLDDGQKKEFEVLIKEFDQRAGRFERGRMGPNMDATLWLEGELPTKERLLLKAENVLLLSEDEKKAVLPKVDAVVAARQKLRDTRREQRKNLTQAVHGGAKEDEVKERLHILREKQVGLEKDLSRAEEELRELLTIDQEARLVAIGILD